MTIPHPSLEHRLVVIEDLRASLSRGGLSAQSVNVKRNQPVYLSGSEANTVYFIERGQIKTALLSHAGKECLLAIHTAGDLFGESCFAGLSTRMETAVAMENTLLKAIHYRNFFIYLQSNSMYEEIVRYFAHRLTEQQEVIADLVTTNSEHRLAKVLLLLGHRLGKKGPSSILIEHRISHEELSQIVGTTRPRVSQFLHKFRNLGLIEISAERFLIIREKELSDYLGEPTNRCVGR
jgi:CRP-like cAMP-binding protein